MSDPSALAVNGIGGSDGIGISLRLLMDPFATSIFAKASALRQLGGALSVAQKRRLSESMSEDVKKATNFHPHDVSEAAAEEARRLGVEDLSEKTWHDQTKFDPKRERFIVEHMVPVSALVYACLNQPDERGVLDVLTERLRVVWLLRREDREITLLGFRHKRPDPDEAYRLAGVRMVPRKRK